MARLHSRLGVVLLLCALIGATAAIVASASRKPTPAPVAMYPNEDSRTSMAELLANRHKYHGRTVTTQGYLVVRFEGTALYMTKDDAEHLLSANAFWINFTGSPYETEPSALPTELNGKYVQLTGVLDKDDFGHLGLFEGAIAEVSRVLVMEHVSHYQRLIKTLDDEENETATDEPSKSDVATPQATN